MRRIILTDCGAAPLEQKEEGRVRKLGSWFECVACPLLLCSVSHASIYPPGQTIPIWTRFHRCSSERRSREGGREGGRRELKNSFIRDRQHGRQAGRQGSARSLQKFRRVIERAFIFPIWAGRPRPPTEGTNDASDARVRNRVWAKLGLAPSLLAPSLAAIRGKSAFYLLSRHEGSAARRGAWGQRKDAISRKL